MFLTYFSKGGGFYRVDGEREFGFEGDLRLAMWRLLFTFAEDRVRFGKGSQTSLPLLHSTFASFVKMYRGCLPRTPSYFLATAQESNQRKPPPDFVPSYLRRLSAKSPQLALRSATGFRHTDFLNAAFAVNMGHIRNGGGQCNHERKVLCHFGHTLTFRYL